MSAIIIVLAYNKYYNIIWEVTQNWAGSYDFVVWGPAFSGASLHVYPKAMT